jgi:hypothetical protein
LRGGNGGGGAGRAGQRGAADRGDDVAGLKARRGVGADLHPSAGGRGHCGKDAGRCGRGGGCGLCRGGGRCGRCRCRRLLLGGQRGIGEGEIFDAASHAQDHAVAQNALDRATAGRFADAEGFRRFATDLDIGNRKCGGAGGEHALELERQRGRLRRIRRCALAERCEGEGGGDIGGDRDRARAGRDGDRAGAGMARDPPGQAGQRDRDRYDHGGCDDIKRRARLTRRKIEEADHVRAPSTKPSSDASGERSPSGIT